AERSAQPLGMSFALTWHAWVHYFRRDAASARTAAERAMTLAKEHGFPQRWAQAAILRGAARAEEGDAAEGAAGIAEGLAAHLASGARVGRAFNLGTLAA